MSVGELRSPCRELRKLGSDLSPSVGGEAGGVVNVVNPDAAPADVSDRQLVANQEFVVEVTGVGQVGQASLGLGNRVVDRSSELRLVNDSLHIHVGLTELIDTGSLKSVIRDETVHSS